MSAATIRLPDESTVTGRTFLEDTPVPRIISSLVVDPVDFKVRGSRDGDDLEPTDLLLVDVP